jgi:hypothetical protein
MTVAQCPVGSVLLEKMTATIDARVRADDSAKTVEERLSAPDTFAAMKEFVTHQRSCSICKRQITDDFCSEGAGLAEKYVAAAYDALKKSETEPNYSMEQANVAQALGDFQRHRRHCDVCRCP